MGTYVPQELLLPVGLDEVGLRLALERLPEEPLSDYRKRLTLEIRDPSDPTQESIVRSTNRKVGQFELPVFEIDLIVDSNEEPLAVDPYIEITSTYLRAYNDYDNSELEFELALHQGARWLVDIVTAFASSAYFSLTILDDYSAYLRADHLRYGNTNKFRHGKQLFHSYQNSLLDRHVKEMWFANLTVFQELKDSREDVTQDGDYWLDLTDGVIISYSTQKGSCSYSYRAFPYTCYWQPVRVLPGNDTDLDYIHKDFLVADETGLEEPLLLNSQGAEIFNRILIKHPLGWGD